MFEYLKKIIGGTHENDASQSLTENNNNKSVNKKIQIAACALFLEMGRADGKFTDEERQTIIKEMEDLFDLEEEAVNELFELAEAKLRDSVSLYEFTGVINAEFSNEQKFSLLESLWRLIYRDEKLSAYEDHLMKKIGAILNLDHKMIIDSKLIVKGELGLK